LIKYPATSAPYKGMVLSNPGGPGGSGVSFVQGTYPTALTILGSNYDFVSWDPRGIGNALPSALCTLSSDLTGAKRKLKPRAPSSIPELEKLYGPTLAPIFFQDRYAEAVEYGPECAASIGANADAGPHMTTATVARDMISILDAFSSSSDGSRCSNDATLLNYWGVSYGTFIGETFANMFPHRVGRVVLDGVLDPDEWIIQSGLNQITHTDDAFATFFIYCNLAGPTLCPFYTGSTPQDIFVRFENIVGQLNATYAFEQGWANATTIELLLSGIKALLFTEVYSPIDTFPIIGRVLPVVESLLPGITIPEIEALAKELGVNITAGLTPQGLWGTEVICSDIGKGKFGEPLSAFDGVIAELERESWLAGEVHSAGLLVCVAWSVESDYRYTGKFRFVGRDRVC
jgi:pimeloyl-ACP methyl ester carboxylesterase